MKFNSYPLFYSIKIWYNIGMKKLIIVGVIMVAFFLGYTDVSAKIFDRDLYFGIEGDRDVTILQEFLSDEGVYSGPITGNFYSLTLRGVKNFQEREGIEPVAGYFGPLTRTRANEIISSVIKQSENQAVIEVGTSTPHKSKVEKQIEALLIQIASLQDQLDSVKNTNYSTPTSTQPNTVTQQESIGLPPIPETQVEQQKPEKKMEKIYQDKVPSVSIIPHSNENSFAKLEITGIKESLNTKIIYSVLDDKEKAVDVKIKGLQNQSSISATGWVGESDSIEFETEQSGVFKIVIKKLVFYGASEGNELIANTPIESEWIEK